jgi:hypothetical protein
MRAANLVVLIVVFIALAWTSRGPGHAGRAFRGRNRKLAEPRENFAGRGTRVRPRMGPGLIARGVSPWYAGTIT